MEFKGGWKELAKFQAAQTSPPYIYIYIWVGDLNATNWHCNGTNKRGKFLEAICDQHNISIINGEESTSRKCSNIIDMVICSDSLIQRINDINIDTSLTESDHWPTTLTLDFKPAKLMKNRIRWERFNIELNEKYQSNQK